MEVKVGQHKQTKHEKLFEGNKNRIVPPSVSHIVEIAFAS